jgi:hypothetical protein
LTFASLGNASHFIGDCMLKVSTLIINSNISHIYFLTRGKFGILIIALTTLLPFDSNFIPLSCIFLLELHILKVVNLTQKFLSGFSNLHCFILRVKLTSNKIFNQILCCYSQKLFLGRKTIYSTFVNK